MFIGKPTTEELEKLEELTNQLHEILSNKEKIEEERNISIAELQKMDANNSVFHNIAVITRAQEEIFKVIGERFIKNLNGDKDKLVEAFRDLFETETTKEYLDELWQASYFTELTSNRGTTKEEISNSYLNQIIEEASTLINAWVYWNFDKDELVQIIQEQLDKIYPGATVALVEDISGENIKIANKRYSKIFQSTAFNQLAKASSKKFNIIDDEKVELITAGDVKVFLDNFKEVKLDTQTHKLLDALTIIYTQSVSDKKHLTAYSIDRKRVVKLDLDDYMKLCKLKDRKEARKQLIKSANVLYNVSLEWTETTLEPQLNKKPKKIRKKREMRIADEKSTWSNGTLEFVFSLNIAKYLAMTTGYIMPYPNNLFSLSAKYNPNSYYLGRRIAEHYNINIGKNNSSIIAVKTLLDATPELPTYEDVLKGKGQIFQRIIEPFERDLNALVKADVLESWEYCNSKYKPLTEDQKNGLNYEIFSNLYIKFVLADYPSQEKRLKEKKERLQLEEEKKEKARQKAIEKNSKKKEETTKK